MTIAELIKRLEPIKDNINEIGGISEQLEIEVVHGKVWIYGLTHKQCPNCSNIEEYDE